MEINGIVEHSKENKYYTRAFRRSDQGPVNIAPGQIQCFFSQIPPSHSSVSSAVNVAEVRLTA